MSYSGPSTTQPETATFEPEVTALAEEERGGTVAPMQRDYADTSCATEDYNDDNPNDDSSSP